VSSERGNAKSSKSKRNRDAQLTLQEAADLLGVHYMTAYRYVRTGRLAGTRDGTHWTVRRSDVDKLAPAAKAGRPNPRRARAMRKDYAQQLATLLVREDEAEAWRLLQSALATAYEPETLYLDVLSPAMRLVGDGWAAGRLDVADEHQATVLAYRLVGRLGPLFIRRGPTRGAVVLGAPEGDPHGLATALIADPLRGRGFSVTDLGANTPAASWVEAIARADRVIGVGIAVSTPVPGAVIADAIAAIKELADAPVVLGGAAIRDEAQAKTLGADAWTVSGRAAVEYFDASVTRPTAPA